MYKKQNKKKKKKKYTRDSEFHVDNTNKHMSTCLVGVDVSVMWLI